MNSLTSALRRVANRSALVALVAVLALAGTRAFASETLEEHWFVLKLQGQKAGWMVDRQVRDDDGTIRSESQLNLSIGRGPSAVTISFENEFRETADGKPLSMTSRQRQGQMGITSTYTFEEGAIRESTQQLDRKTENTHPWPEGEWLTPNQVRRRIEENIDSGAKEFSFRMMDPMLGPRAFEVSTRIIGRANIEVQGKVVPAIEWESRQSYLPDVVSRDFVNERGLPLKTQIDLGGIKMEILAADKDLALAPSDAPELMASTLVVLDKPIENPRNAKRAVFIVSQNTEGKLSIPQTSVQSTSPAENGALRVVIDVSNPNPAPAAEAQDKRFRVASATIDCDDPEIQKLVAQALNDKSASEAAKAESLRQFVSSFIHNKDLGVGLATASEVCRTRQGDCSEHAVLLAAMLRAAGIPSRLASGVVYIDEFLGKQNVLGYHMWTQALIDVNGKPTWVDVDATLGPRHAFDATHICLTLSSGAELGDDAVINSLVPIATMLGTLNVEVESVQ